ncbi:hypothetical protein [Nocardia sp. AG03]|uniref:hypothetical protein n=1 Tax=Nocardia sp. AG03 TaxID=3025312 RepID=UPI0024187B76|nr:hypothetical protein [Nocardia sp. AG03]
MRDVFDPLADIDRALAEQAGWTWFDDYLLYTCGVAELLASGRVTQIPSAATRVRLDAGEICFADGGAQWFTWRGLGDGRWTPGRTAADGRTPLGRVAHLGNAVRNESRRLRAEAAEQPRWVTERPGTAMISNQRIHLANPDRAFALHWSALESVDLSAPDLVGCRFPNQSGTMQQLQIRSAWAPLIFVTAALRHFPHHPLVRTGAWLPAGFEDKCHLAGKTCPKVRAL